MYQTIEGEFELSDGVKLYTKTWMPENGTTPTGHVIFLHGYSDHCNAYYDLFPTLSSPPFSLTVHTFDQRGWGRSVHKDGDKGLTGGTPQVMADFHEFICHIAAKPEVQSSSLFLMGHSMGGLNSLYYMLSNTSCSPFSHSHPRPKFAGLLLEAPYIELDPKSQPNGLVIFFGKLGARLFPHFQPKSEKLDSKYMSRNPQVCKDWADDLLNHDTPTLEGASGMFQRAADLTSLSYGKIVDTMSVSLPCPIWQSHGSGDRVISYTASKRLYEHLQAPNGDKTFKTYDGGYHKLHADGEGVAEAFAKDAGEWIMAHISQTHGETKVGQ